MFQSRLRSLSLRLYFKSRPQGLIHSHITRSLSSTAPFQATETSKPDAEAVAAAVEKLVAETSKTDADTVAAAVEKLVARRPELILAARNMREELVKIAGDFTLEPEKSPDVEKYLAMPEFSEAAFKLMQELQKAGVDSENQELGALVAGLIVKKTPKV